MVQGKFVMRQATSPRLLTTNRNVSSLRFLKFSFPVTPYQLAGKGSGGGGGGGGRGGGKGIEEGENLRLREHYWL